MRRPIPLLMLPFIAVLVGCAGGPSANTLRGRSDFYAHDYAAAVKRFRTDENKHDRDYVMYNLDLGAAALGGGDVFDARRALLNAVMVMNSDAGKAAGIVSLFGDEAFKLFKGEPFEKAMAYVYLGVGYYNDGDYENARAAFSQALLMDKQSQDGYREDLRLVFFLVGKCYLKLKDTENARIAFNKANQRNPGEPYGANPYYDIELAKRANVTLLVEMGRAPVKYRHGPGASLDSFARAPYPERRARIYFDGALAGETSPALDLFYEAQHRGSSGKDVVQGTKGVVRDAAVVTAAVSRNKSVQLGALAVALLNQSQADIRQWELLPGEVQVYSAQVGRGLKTLVLEFTDRYGGNLSAYRQVWYYVPVEAPRERLYLLRSGFGKGKM